MQPVWLCILSGRRFEDTFENTQWRKVKQMQTMWLRLFSGKHFDGSFENTQRREVKQMQPMWLCLFSGKHFEESFKNAQWRKVTQMQPMWLCLLCGGHFEEPFENSQWRKIKQMQPVWLCLLSPEFFDETCEKAQCKKEKRDSRSFWTNPLRTHLKHRQFWVLLAKIQIDEININNFTFGRFKTLVQRFGIDMLIYQHRFAISRQATCQHVAIFDKVNSLSSDSQIIDSRFLYPPGVT